MGSEGPQLHVVFFPLLAYGHMIPVADVAKLFAARGVKATIITTPANAPVFTRALDNNRYPSLDIDIEIFTFPSKEVGLPEGLENFDNIPTDETTINKFIKGIKLLHKPLEKYLAKHQPNCIVADMFLPWAADVAAIFNIPRLVFHGSNYFSICIEDSLRLNAPHKLVSSDDEQFIVPNLPHDIKVKRKQATPHIFDTIESDAQKWSREGFESESKGYGVIMNSFYELEPAYADHHKNVLGRRSWRIGPVSICNKNIEDKTRRGKGTAIDEHSCLKWLSSKEPNSVIYLCFGSMVKFSRPQLREIAMALEASKLNFIWVIKMEKDDASNVQDGWLPKGFEQKTQDKGLIIRGWAPQVLILDHESIGAFVTHCGWNSVLEAISAGKPMVTWPVFAEQFFNEKLVTDILKAGIPVGTDQPYWGFEVTEANMKCDDIKKVLSRIMVGEDAVEIRSRAMTLKEKARKAIEEGGSSYSDLSILIEELSCHHA